MTQFITLRREDVEVCLRHLIGFTGQPEQGVHDRLQSALSSDADHFPDAGKKVSPDPRLSSEAVAWRAPQPSKTRPWAFAWDKCQLDAWREVLDIEGEPLFLHPPRDAGGGWAMSEVQYDGVREMIRQAFIQGCKDVHENHHDDADPDFTEAAYDYTTSVTDDFIKLFPSVPASPPQTGEAVKLDSFELPADHPFVIAMSQPLSERTKAELRSIDLMIHNAHAAGDFRVGSTASLSPAEAVVTISREDAQEPVCKFDAMSPEQEELALQFCSEISGKRGQPPHLPGPVRLLEMAEALYQAELKSLNGAG